MVAVLGYSKAEIRQAVEDMYTVVALEPESDLHFPIGREAAVKAGYSEPQLHNLPGEVIESFAGVGCPFQANVIQPGHTVLDVGSGSGTDVLIAAQLVGPSGQVKAFDMTPAMRNKLEATLQRHAITNVEILAGDAERLPLPDQSVDVVTSNGVLNLVPDKRQAIREIFRVLKPGGKVQIADIVIANPVTPDCEDDPKLWAECVVGATVDENYLEMFHDAGFEQVEVLRDYDYFAYSPSADTREVARQFGAHAFELVMTRKERAPARAMQWLYRFAPHRLVRDVQRRGLWGCASLLMAAIACYGTLALVALLSMLGVTLAFNEAIWASSIVAFSVGATAVIALGVKRHNSFKPLVPGLLGSGLMVYTMFIDYSLLTELIAFALLAVAIYLDYHLRRWAQVTPERRTATRKSPIVPSHRSTTG